MPLSPNPDSRRVPLLALTQTAVGCAIGILLGGKLGQRAQKMTATTMLSVAALLAVPTLVVAVRKRVNGPGSERGERRRLESIRTDAGYHDSVGVL